MDALYEVIFGVLSLFVAMKSTALIRYKMFVFVFVIAFLNFSLLFSVSNKVGLGYYVLLSVLSLFFLFLGLKSIEKFELEKKE